MANKSRIAGITVEIGGDVSGLDKALSGVNKNINKTQSELKDVERLLKLDPTNTELLEQKQRLLSEAVAETGGKLETLKEAEKQVQKQFERGDIGQDKYDALKREIIATETKLDGFKTSARQAEKAVEGINEDPVDDVRRAADKAGDALDNAANDAADFGDVLTAGGIIEGVKGIAGAIGDLADETAEYRKIMGTLETSSEAAGYTAEQTQQAYNQLYGVLGDDQSTATTVANLQAVGLSQSQLMTLIGQTTGAWAKYGDSIPIDGLAEAINETAKAGQITGVLADVINWGAKEGETYGVQLKQNIEFQKLNERQLASLTAEQRAAYDAQKKLYEETEAYNKSVEDAASAEDFFNIALKNCSSESERANLIMQAMSDQGLGRMGDAWRDNNADIVAANDAQNQYMENAARIGDAAAPAITAAKDGMSDLMGVIAGIIEQIDMDAVVEGIDTFFTILGDGVTWIVENKEIAFSILTGIIAAMATMKGLKIINGITEVIGGVKTLAGVFPSLGSAIGMLTNPVALIAGAVVGLVVLIGTKGDEIQAILQKLDDWLQGVFATDWTTIFGPVLGGVLNQFFDTAKGIWDGFKRFLDGIIDFIRGVFTGDWNRAWNGVKEIFGGIFDSLVAIARTPINAVITLVNGLIRGVCNGVNGVISLLNKLPGVSVTQLSAPQIPMLANGGVLSKGSAIVGEAGPELLTMAHGSAVVRPLSSGTAQGAGNAAATGYGGPQTIIVQSVLDGRVIGETAYNYGRKVARAYGN